MDKAAKEKSIIYACMGFLESLQIGRALEEYLEEL